MECNGPDMRIIEVEEDNKKGAMKAVGGREKKKVVRERVMGWQGGTSAYLGI